MCGIWVMDEMIEAATALPLEFPPVEEVAAAAMADFAAEGKFFANGFAGFVPVGRSVMRNIPTRREMLSASNRQNRADDAVRNQTDDNPDEKTDRP